MTCRRAPETSGTAPLSPRLAGPGSHYAYCVHGPNEPEKGHRFDRSVLLIDPFARAAVRVGSAAIAGDRPQLRLAGDRPPATPWRDTLIYELHVKGFTRLHPAVPADWRGKYLGLTRPAVIEHLKSIGVTAVELLPCQAFLSEQFLRERGLDELLGLQLRWPGSRPRTNMPCAMRWSNSRPW